MLINYKAQPPFLQFLTPLIFRDRVLKRDASPSSEKFPFLSGEGGQGDRVLLEQATL